MFVPGEGGHVPRLIDHDERREAFAEATWRVILRDGVGKVSVRTVAAEAGHSAGSLRHVFASQSELLVFALQLVVDRAGERVDELREVPDPLERVQAVAAQLLPLDAQRRAEMEVYLALFTAANADADLRPARDAAHHSVLAGCRWMIEQLDTGGLLAGDADRELEARRLHAVIDGLAAHLIYEPADADPEWARQVLVRHLRALGG